MLLCPSWARRYVTNVVGTELGRLIVAGTIKPSSTVVVDTVTQSDGSHALQFKVEAAEAAKTVRPAVPTPPPTPPPVTAPPAAAATGAAASS